jgi:hypothetical protein
MHWFALGTALLVAVAIIAIGTQYIVSPLTAICSFGLPLPENRTNIAWWLRLKGVRDILSGLTGERKMAFAIRSACCLVGPSADRAAEWRSRTRDDANAVSPTSSTTAWRWNSYETQRFEPHWPQSIARWWT